MTLRARAGDAGRAAHAAAQKTGRAMRRATHAGGAGRTGLGSLIELNAINSAGDALIAVALAGTMFFSLDVKQAQGQVALYLLVTMAPFALVAPLIGPTLDHMRHARRVAIAGTMLARGLLCWGMAGAVLHKDPLTLMPAAFGALVLSKAFGVSRSAVTPRVLPEGLNLVTANARASFGGLVAAAVVTPVGAGLIALTNAGWALRIATLVFIAGAILGIRLPGDVDTPETGEPQPVSERMTGQVRWRTLLRVGPVVGEAMRANAALRAFSGFLILYLAFLLRTKSFIHPVSPNIALGLLAAAAGAGGLVGTALGALAKARAPRAIVFGTLAFATLTAAVCAVFFGLVAALVVAFVGALGQSLGKLGLDAIVQREIGEEVRSSTFAVTETVHQLVWVIGGLIGLGMSIVASNGHIALSIVAAALAAWLFALVYRRAARRVHRRRQRGPEGEPVHRAGGEPVHRAESEPSIADTA
jgi:MFS family permease